MLPGNSAFYSKMSTRPLVALLTGRTGMTYLRLLSGIRSQGVFGGRSCDKSQPLLVALCKDAANEGVLIDALWCVWEILDLNQ
jgi:hypothetical protein